MSNDRYILVTHYSDGSGEPWVCPVLLTQRERDLLVLIQKNAEGQEWMIAEVQQEPTDDS